MKKEQTQKPLQNLNRSETIYAFAFLFILVFITYLNVLNADFVSDDIPGIRANPSIGNFGEVFARPLQFFRPLLLFISFKLGGMTPFFYRIFNIVFHIGTAWSLYIFLALLFNVRYALLAASLFAVHPLFVESVTWISGVSYSQYSFFLMSSLVAYILGKRSKKWYYSSVILFAFSMLSSEKAVIFPIILLLLDFSFFSLRGSWRKTIPYFLIAAIVGGLLVLNIGSRVTSFQTDFYQKPYLYNPLEQIPVAVTSYIQLLFWPDGLTLYHSELAMSTSEFVFRWILLLMFLAAVAISYKRNRVLFFWLVFFFVALSPTLIPLSIVWVVAERYAYLAAIGIICAFSYVVTELIKNNRQKTLLYVLVSVAVLSLMMRSIIRNIDWQNEDNLWFATGKTSPSSHNTHNNLGDVYGRRKDYPNAIAEFKKAIEIKPDYADAYHNLANTYMEMGNYEEAVKGYENALKYNPRLWQSHQNLGAIYFEISQYDKAIAEFRKAIILDPYNANLHKNLGVIYLKAGKKSEAKDSFYKALQLNPTLQEARLGIQESEK